MVTLFLQNNCSKWANDFGTNFKKTELISEQVFCSVAMGESNLSPLDFLSAQRRT